MIIFLHGPNAFASRQKLNALIEQFKKTRDQHGDNVVFLDGERLTVDELDAKLSARSLLAQKRLVVVNGLFSHREENIWKDVLVYLKNAEKNNDNVLIFYEANELDAKGYGAKKLTATRKALFDYLSGQKYSEKFPQLNRANAAAWLTKTAAERTLTIAPGDINLLLNLSGNDLWTLHHDMQKLIHFVKGRKQTAITAADIRLLVTANADDNIFSLTDSVSNNNPVLFFSLLNKQLDAGTSWQQILTMLTRQFKIILQVKELLLQQKKPANIAGLLKLHPFVVQKSIAQTRNFSVSYLKNIIRQLIDIDCQTKTGQTPSGLTSLNLLFLK